MPCCRPHVGRSMQGRPAALGGAFHTCPFIYVMQGSKIREGWCLSCPPLSSLPQPGRLRSCSSLALPSRRYLSDRTGAVPKAEYARDPARKDLLSARTFLTEAHAAGCFATRSPNFQIPTGRLKASQGSAVVVFWHPKQL